MTSKNMEHLWATFFPNKKETLHDHYENNLYIFWDVESTSKDVKVDAIISLGAVITKFDEKECKFISLGEFHQYINTDIKINPAAQKIHRISKEMLKEQPKFVEAMNLFTKWVNSFTTQHSQTVLIAHNGEKFDNLILFCNCVKEKVNFDNFLESIQCEGFIDSLKFIKNLYKNLPESKQPRSNITQKKSFALSTLYTSFCGGDELENAHDALVDSKALLSVFNSHHICNHNNVYRLVKSIVKRMYVCENIRKSVGIKFKSMENDVKNMNMINNEEILSLPNLHNEFLHGYIFCLSCITYNLPHIHHKCQ